MSSDANLLALPYELREQIFRHYFKLDRGYFYDGESEKLVTADGQPIDLSLMYTCHSIANNTKHIPLSVNTITFSTVYREDWRERAGGLAYILKCHNRLQADMVYHLLGFVTPEMYSQIGLKFPQSMPNIREELTTELQFHEQTNWRYERLFSHVLEMRLRPADDHRGILNYTLFDRFQWKLGPTHSSILGAAAYTLSLLAEKHPAEFAELIDKALPGWTDSHSPDEFFHLTFDPWAIPSLSELVETADQLQAYRFWECLGTWHHNRDDLDTWHPHRDNEDTGNRYRQKLYFSAAAVAIRFLNQLPETRRLQIRNIIINEDRLAVGWSEGHILGLIPFCRENPGLRVKQRVNLWRNLLLRMHIPRPIDAIRLAELGHSGDNDQKVYLYHINSALASWAFHVMEVMDEGMPAGTFSFVLEGDPDLNLSSEVFDTQVHPTVAWLKAYAECSSQGLFPQPYEDIFYFSTAAYLKAMELLINGAPFLQINFNVGQPWDYKKLAETHQDLPQSAWRAKYCGFSPAFDVSSPTLDWISIKLEFLEMQTESDYLESAHIFCKREKKRLRRLRRRSARIEEAEVEDDTEAGQTMRTLFGDVHKAPPCMTRFEKRMHRKERRAQKAAASASDQTQTDLTDIGDMESTIFGDFFEPRTGLWWW
ncbi:hypothetical protein CEP54_010231 [Fusarium duplospermum]|uniref:Uncharacterized protein n=1 Tax=Fusarium duplospermum TaxID=1325734 RepID=A0A428PL49_9HYPO|nr:hypothetical protein CEP54_010231 [Fusarium duplospermum]